MINSSKKLALCGMASFGLSMLVSCDDSSSTANESAGVNVLEEGVSLPKCNAENAGNVVYSSDSAAIYYCVNGDWLALKGTDGADGANGKNGKDCSAERIDKGIVVSCDGVAIDTIASGTDGKDGEDGTDGKDGKDGADGKDGQNGTDGKDGEDGSDGKDGEDGTDCSAEIIDEGIEVSCNGKVLDTLQSGTNGIDGKRGTDGKDGEDGLPGEDGIDGINCEAELIDEGVQVSCDGSVVDTLRNGADGANGTDASKSAYDIAVENGFTGTVTEWLASLAGANGINCTAADTTDNEAGKTGYKITCGSEIKGVLWNGTNNTTNGRDGNGGCTMTDNGDGTMSVTCGAEGSTQTITLYKAMCGITPYDPAKKFCQNNTIYDLCNGNSYDVTSKFCQNNTTYDLCGSYSYDVTSEFCQNSSIYQMCNGAKYDATTKFCDQRDGELYKYVTINYTQWMAENLNYNGGTNKYHSNNSNNSKGYGRIYLLPASSSSTGSASMASSSSGDDLCPEGWRLPTKYDFEDLVNTDATITSNATISANLRSTTWGGTDLYGFNALPARSCSILSCVSILDETYFWSSTTEGTNAYVLRLSASSYSISTSAFGSNYHYIRCIQ